MGGSIDISKTVRASFGLYSDKEKAAVKSLYRQTSPHGKDALLSIPQTTTEQKERLAELGRLVDQIIQENKGKKGSERQLELEPIRKLIEALSEESQEALKNGPRTGRGLTLRKEALLELLAKEEEEKKAKALSRLYKAREQLLLDTNDLATQRHRLPTMLTYYTEELARTNPAIFRFLTEEQKLRLENKLLHTYLIIYSQYQLDVAEGRAYALAGHQELLDLCSKRIEELKYQPVRGEKIDFQDDLDQEISFFTKALKFLGITILAAWVVEKIFQFIDKKTVIKEWMSEINGKRLYWVWGGGMLASILDLLPQNFYSAAQAPGRLAAPSKVTGYMSWVLYYFRLGINLFLLLKHTINGPWMSEEESEIPVWERFTTQWEQRKFAILNDLFWAPINMACFLWLKGPGMLGYVGNLVTVVLLTMDLALSLWKHWEETTKHNAEMLALAKDQRDLRRKIEEQKARRDRARTVEERAMYQASIAELEEQEKALRKMEVKARFEWKYKEFGLFNDCCYALGLLLAFCVVICFFFPPAALAPATVMIFGLCGAVACFLATAIYSGVNCYLERAKTLEQRQMNNDECAKLFDAFKEERDPLRRKQLYLEMKTLMAESDYQHRLAKHQLIKSFVSILIDAAFPAVVFSTIVFAPAGLGIGAIIGIIAAVMLVSWYFNNIILKNVEPKPHDLPEFDNEEYEALVQTVEENRDLSLDDASEFLMPPERGKALSPRGRFFDGEEPSESYFRLGSVDDDASGSESSEDGEDVRLLSSTGHPHS